MRMPLMICSIAAAAGLSDSGGAPRTAQSTAAREGRIEVGTASLYSREVGRGHPLIAVFRQAYVEKLGGDLARQQAIVATAAYKAGDPETVAARYRLHFKPALARLEDYEKLMTTMKAAFISQGRDGIVKGVRSRIS
jgi:hypothetical protein